MPLFSGLFAIVWHNCIRYVGRCSGFCCRNCVLEIFPALVLDHTVTWHKNRSHCTIINDWLAWSPLAWCWWEHVLARSSSGLKCFKISDVKMWKCVYLWCSQLLKFEHKSFVLLLLKLLQLENNCLNFQTCCKNHQQLIPTVLGKRLGRNLANVCVKKCAEWCLGCRQLHQHRTTEWFGLEGSLRLISF